MVRTFYFFFRGSFYISLDIYRRQDPLLNIDSEASRESHQPPHFSLFPPISMALCNVIWQLTACHGNGDFFSSCLYTKRQHPSYRLPLLIIFQEFHGTAMSTNYTSTLLIPQTNIRQYGGGLYAIFSLAPSVVEVNDY